MNYKIQQLHYSKNMLTYSEPSKVNAPSKNIAIIAHVFYLDIWQEIKNYLSHLEIEYDLFITLSEGATDNEIIEIFKSTPDIQIYVTENRGRDVLPFLQVMDIIGASNYKYICKVHTKKTGESDLGHVWRKLLYFDLLGSNDTVNAIINLLENDGEIGVITGKNTILDSLRYAYGNSKKIDSLAEKAGFTYDEFYTFPAGTMFWARPEIVVPVVELFTSGQLDFEEETGQKDGALAHAIERFFGVICQVNEKKIVGSPSLYSQLDNQTLNDLASLVLSRKYVGIEKLAKSLYLKKRLENITLDKIIFFLEKKLSNYLK